VDAFHPVNVGKLMIGNPDFLPCTPAGVMELIRKAVLILPARNVSLWEEAICGKAHGNAFAGSKRHCDRVPFQDAKY